MSMGLSLDLNLNSSLARSECCLLKQYNLEKKFCSGKVGNFGRTFSGNAYIYGRKGWNLEKTNGMFMNKWKCVGNLKCLIPSKFIFCSLFYLHINLNCGIICLSLWTALAQGSEILNIPHNKVGLGLTLTVDKTQDKICSMIF